MFKKHTKSALRNSNLWVFIILLTFSIISYIIQENLKLNVIKEVSNVVFYPVQKTISFTKTIFSLQRKNILLKKKIAAISLEIQRYKNIRRENKILRELYGFKSMIDYNLIPCEIIGKSPGLYNRSLIINGGRKNGIEKNMTVISADGLVGKIIEANNSTSELLTLYDRNCFISGIDLRSRVQGIVKWQNGRFLIFDDVPLHSDVRIGDTLLTSGMGSIFPKGIFIGMVSEVKENPKEIVMQIEIEPFVKFSLLENVFVITEGKTSGFFATTDTVKTKRVMVHIDMFKIIKKPQIFNPPRLQYQLPNYQLLITNH